MKKEYKKLFSNERQQQKEIEKFYYTLFLRKSTNNLRLSCENSSLLFNFARTFAMLINLSLIMWLAICLFFFFFFFCTRLCVFSVIWYGKRKANLRIVNCLKNEKWILKRVCCIYAYAENFTLKANYKLLPKFEIIRIESQKNLFWHTQIELTLRISAKFFFHI